MGRRHTSAPPVPGAQERAGNTLRVAHHVVPGTPAPLSGPDDVVHWVARTCLAPVEETRLGTVGAEVESLVVDPAAPGQRVALERVQAVFATVGDLPGGGVLHVEPGGQVEVATSPHPDTGSCVRALRADLTVVEEAMTAAGLRARGLGTDPLRPPGRLVEADRYDAMEAFFATDVDPCAGPLLMGCSASVQVSVEPGVAAADDVRGVARRWRLAHALGPLLVATFAASPLLEGAVTGWRSSRQWLWERIDPSRVLPAPDTDPVLGWAHTLLDARLMFVRDPAGDDPSRVEPVLDGLTFGDWLRGAPGLRPPTTGDLTEHATTLFPPVRPRGPLEVRYLDRPPDPWSAVPVAVVGALLDAPDAAAQAERIAAPHADRWEEAARSGLAADGLAEAATALLDLALAALPDVGAGDAADLVAAYGDRWTRRGRCPADDLLDAVAAGATATDLLLGQTPQEAPTAAPA